jgi:hypothetical protein
MQSYSHISQLPRNSSFRLPVESSRIFTNSRSLQRNEHLQTVERNFERQAIVDSYRDVFMSQFLFFTHTFHSDICLIFPPADFHVQS